MFGKMMNNYYYGKSGKGDFKKDDLPSTRWQLFWDTLKTRLSSLVRLNLMYFVVWIPTVIVLFIGIFRLYNFIMPATVESLDASGNTVISAMLDENGEMVAGWQQMGVDPSELSAVLNMLIMRTLLFLVPCIAITGPATAGVCYVTRNWSRDEHAFIWSDFIDALKENWKQSLPVSLITGLAPLIAYMCWTFYGEMAQTQTFMMVPQMLTLMIVILWALCVTYIHPMIVSYELGLKGIFKNGILLGIAKLPASVGIRLLHCVPTIIAVVVVFLFGVDPMIVLLILAAYYALIGLSLSRFVTASYTNSVFDRYINSKIEGAPVNKGLHVDDEDDDGEMEDGDEH